MNEVLLTLLFVVISAFYAGVETGAYRLNRLRLRLRASEGDARATRLQKLLRDPQMFVATMLSGTNLTRYGASAFATAFFTNIGVSRAEIAATAALTPIALVLGEILPKAFFAIRANTVLYRLTWPLRATILLTWPLSMALKGVMFLFTALMGRDDDQLAAGRITARRIRYFLSEGRVDGAVSEDQGRIAHNIMKLRETDVSSVMTPLPTVQSVEQSSTGDDVRAAARTVAHSRLPVYEGQPENIVGVVVLLELLCAENDPDSLEGFIREPGRLQPRQGIESALRQLRRGRQHMGIVTDADGRAIGIVTLKDLVEEIVGELEEW